MARLIGHRPGYLLIVCESAKDLRDLAKRAGLKVATECRCGKCELGSGRHGFVDGETLLDQIIQATGERDYRERFLGKGLYLVSKFGHAPVSDSSMLGSVCSPVLRRRRWGFQIGLNFAAGSGTASARDIPEVAHRLAEVAGSS